MSKQATLSLSVAGLILLAAGCYGVSHEAPTTLAQAQSQAADRGVPILLDFYTDW